MLFWNVVAADLLLNFYLGEDKEQASAGLAFCASIVTLVLVQCCRAIFRTSNSWLDEERSPLLATAAWGGGWCLNMLLFALALGLAASGSRCLNTAEARHPPTNLACTAQPSH